MRLEPRTVYEADIEKKIVAAAERLGWWVAKFVSPGLNGVPDRIFLRLVGNRFRCVFIEVKRPDEEPSAQQAKRHRELREHGAEVYWVDSLEKALEILR
jgi:hypothetical protein